MEKQVQVAAILITFLTLADEMLEVAVEINIEAIPHGEHGEVHFKDEETFQVIRDLIFGEGVRDEIKTILALRSIAGVRILRDAPEYGSVEEKVEEVAAEITGDGTWEAPTEVYTPDEILSHEEVPHVPA